jgi:hypothetical protein
MKRDRKPGSEAPLHPRPRPALNVTIWGWGPSHHLQPPPLPNSQGNGGSENAKVIGKKLRRIRLMNGVPLLCGKKMTH